MKKKVIIFTIISTIFLIYIGKRYFLLKKERSGIFASGIVEATEVDLRSKLIGDIIELKVDEGDEVKKGDLLLVIDHVKLDLQLKEAQSKLREAKEILILLRKGAREEEILSAKELSQSAAADLALARKNLKRIIELYKDEVVSKHQLDEAKSWYDSSYANYKSAFNNYIVIKKGSRDEEIRAQEAKVKSLIATCNIIKEKIDDAFVRAPIDGVITEKYVEMGETVGKGSFLLTIADLKRPYVNLYVNEDVLGRIKLGDIVKIKVDSLPNRYFKGKVVLIGSKAEFTPKNVQTQNERVKLVYKIKVDVENPELLLKIGMPADGWIISSID